MHATCNFKTSKINVITSNFQHSPTLRKLAHGISRYFFSCKNIKSHLKKFDSFNMLAQNFVGACLAEAVLMSTHNLCFGSQIRKIGIPCNPQFYNVKVGYEGVYISQTC